VAYPDASWGVKCTFPGFVSQLYEEKKFFSWGLSHTLVRDLPPLSEATSARNVFTGKFAMKRLKQTSYVAATPLMSGARGAYDGDQQPTPAPFQS